MQGYCDSEGRFLTNGGVALFTLYLSIRDMKQSTITGALQFKEYVNTVCSASVAADAARKKLKSSTTVLLVTSAYAGLLDKHGYAHVRLLILQKNEIFVYDPMEKEAASIGSVCRLIAKRLGIKVIQVLYGDQKEGQWTCTQRCMRKVNRILNDGFTPKAREVLRVCCALLNAFFPAIESDVGYQDEIVTQMLRKQEKENKLDPMVRDLNMIRMRTQFTLQDVEDINSWFRDEVSIDDLYFYAQGSYALKSCASYFHDACREHMDGFHYELFETNDLPPDSLRIII